MSQQKLTFNGLQQVPHSDGGSLLDCSEVELKVVKQKLKVQVAMGHHKEPESETENKLLISELLTNPTHEFDVLELCCIVEPVGAFWFVG
jgi:hypothetical protein